MRWRRHLSKILILLVLVGLFVVIFRPRPLLVDTEAVTRGEMAQTVEEEGKTRVMERYLISAPVTAQSRRIVLEAGDTVLAGEVVVVLDALVSPPLDARAVAVSRARVEAAEAALQTARSDAEAIAASARFAEAEAVRLRRLAEENLIAPREVEAAEAESRSLASQERSARARVQAARFEVEAARTALAFAGEQDPEASGRIDLRSPITGAILRRYFESTQVVQPGEPILEIGDPTLLEVQVEVLSADAVRIEPGMRVFFERWGRPRPLEGRVRRIEPGGFTKISALGVEEQRVLVIVDFTSPKEEWTRLGDAFRVNAHFVLWEASDVLRLPTSALFRHQDGWAVFTVENGRARQRLVETGERGGRFTRVLAGIAEGEAVIVHPPRELEEGTRVQTRQAMP
jgi:HlyD family secretion protein